MTTIVGHRLHLILVRHGQPQSDVTRDPPLSALGVKRAAQSAERLAREPIDCIYSSGMARADATAAPLAARLGLPIHIDQRLGEVDRVTGQYHSIETVRAKGRDEWDRFTAAPLAYFGVDAPSFRAEVLAGFEAVLTQGTRIAVFTHGFPINILLGHALGINHDARFVPSYGSISRLTGRSLQGFTVLSINETAHFVADDQ